MRDYLIPLMLQACHQGEEHPRTWAGQKIIERTGQPCSLITVVIRIPSATKTQPDQKQLREERVCFSTELSGRSPSQKQGRVGTETENMAEHYLLAPHRLLKLFSDTAQDTRPSTAPTHSGLGPLESIINQNNAVQNNPQASLMEASSHSWFPPPREAWVELTETNQYHYQMPSPLCTLSI